MENALSFLNSATQKWLSFASTFGDIEPNYIFLSVAGALFFFLIYHKVEPFLLAQTNQDTQEQEDKAKNRRKVSSKEFRSSHRKQERRSLLAVVQSPSGQLYDPSHFRKFLCPDPGCDVCNGATAKVSRLLSRANLEDDAASVSSVPSTDSVTVTSYTLSPSVSPNPPGCHISSLSSVPSPPPSICSTNKTIPLEDICLGTRQGDSLPTKPTLPTRSNLPLNHIPPHPLPMRPPVAQPAIWHAERPSQPETTPFVPGSPSEPSVNATIDKHAGAAKSGVPQQQTSTHNFSPSQSKCLVNQVIDNSHSAEAFCGGQATVHFKVPGNPSLPSPEDLVVLDTQDKSQADVLTPRDEEGEAESGQNIIAIWKENSGGSSLPLGGSKGTLSKWNPPQRHAHLQTSLGQLEHRPVQLFWGLPYLHSESIGAITTVSAHGSSTCIWFNRNLDPPVLTPSTPLCLPERQTQALAQSPCQSLLLARPQTQLPPPIPVLPPSPRSQLSIYGVYFHGPKDGAKSLMPSEICHLEYNIMTKGKERVRALPSVVRPSQEEISLLPSKASLARPPSETHSLRYVPPETLPLTDEFQEKLEHHLQRRLILQHQGLPQRIPKSQPWVSPDLPESSMRSSRLPHFSFFKPQDSKDPPNTVFKQPASSQDRCSEALSAEGKMQKARGQSPEMAQKSLGSNTKGKLDDGLPSGFEKTPPRHFGTPLGKPPGISQVSQCREKIEAILKEQLTRHLNVGQVSGIMSRPEHPPLPFSSAVSTEDHQAQRQSPSDNRQNMAKSIVPQTSIVLDNTSLEKSAARRHSPDVSRMSAEAGPVPLGKSLSSDQTVQGPQGTNGKNKVGIIVKGGQRNGLQPKPPSQYKKAQGADKYTKAQSPLLAGRAVKGTLGPQESQTCDFNKQVYREAKFKWESSQPIQAVRPQKDRLPVPHKPSLSLEQSPSSGARNGSQGQKLHSSTAETSVQQPKGHWMPPCVSDKGQKKDTPPSVPRKPDELGAAVAGPGTSQPSGKSYHVQDSPTLGIHGKKPTPPLPLKTLTPPEHQFGKQVKHFFQWLSPDKTCKGQEGFLRKSTPPSSPGQDPKLKWRATPPGNTVAQNTAVQKALRELGKVPKEQLGQKHGAAESTPPSVPLSPPTKPVTTKTRKESWVPAETMQGHQFYRQATCCKEPSPRSYNQATALVGQKRWVEDRGRQPQKCEALQPRPPAPHREPELHQNLLLRSRAGQGPRAAGPFAVLADVSQLCEQKILAQNPATKGLLPQKQFTS